MNIEQPEDIDALMAEELDAKASRLWEQGVQKVLSDVADNPQCESENVSDYDEKGYAA